MEQQTGFKEMFLRLVAIVGLIAVLILGAWGIILLAFNLVGLVTGSVSLSNLFSGTGAQPATTTAPVVITQDGTGQTTSKPTSSVAPAAPTYVYTQAPRVSELYGLADLKVSITSVTSLSSVQGRTVVQFIVENAGTNVARSGWSFNALLPLSPSYTYQSQAQQALYPGDKIAYTLTYDDPRFRYNQPCTLQYPNYDCNYYNQYDYQYNYQHPYQYNQQNTGICYTYNGYQNIPGPCPTPANPNYNYFDQFNQYNPNYYGGYGYYPRGGVVTITVDPQNWVPEAVEWNNSASKSVY